MSNSEKKASTSRLFSFLGSWNFFKTSRVSALQTTTWSFSETLTKILASSEKRIFFMCILCVPERTFSPPGPASLRTWRFFSRENSCRDSLFRKLVTTFGPESPKIVSAVFSSCMAREFIN